MSVGKISVSTKS